MENFQRLSTAQIIRREVAKTRRTPKTKKEKAERKRGFDKEHIYRQYRRFLKTRPDLQDDASTSASTTSASTYSRQAQNNAADMDIDEGYDFRHDADWEDNGDFELSLQSEGRNIFLPAFYQPRTKEPKKRYSERARLEPIWETYGMRLVALYLEAIRDKLPEPSLCSPSCLSEIDCNCEKKTQKVRVYMFFETIAMTSITIAYCNCRPLVETLMLMQMLPTTPSFPRVAIHFGFLDVLHALKMEANVSNHAMTNVVNGFYMLANKETISLNKSALNDTYALHRRVVNHAEGMATVAIGTKNEPCLACLNAPIKMVTMDGNMQLKRLAGKNEQTPSSGGVFSPSEAMERLWGPKEEAEVFEVSRAASRTRNAVEKCLAATIYDNTFRASSGASRTSARNFTEKGIFAMCCARHGVPSRLYDIYNGEGAQFAMASVKHIVESGEAQELIVMYDIACQYRRRIESSISDETGKPRIPVRFAVPAFHAYAHVMSCQVNYNPRYLKGMGRTDGEGCERFWSYLNGFVSITRQMTKPNRQLLITDAVSHYIGKKMTGMVAELKSRSEKCERELSKLGTMTTWEASHLESEWNNWSQNMSLLSVEAKVEEIKKKINENGGEVEESLPVYYSSFIALKSLPVISEDNYGLCRAARSGLTSIVSLFNNVSEPSSTDDVRCQPFKDLINLEVAKFYRSLLESYATCIILNEDKLKRGHLGTKLSAKVNIAKTDLFQKGEIIRQAFVKYIEDNEDEKEKVRPPQSVSQIVQNKRQDAEGKSTSLSDEIARFHKLQRYTEEKQMLKEETVRFIQNLRAKKEAITRALPTAGPGITTLLRRDLAVVEYCQVKAAKLLPGIIPGDQLLIDARAEEEEEDDEVDFDDDIQEVVEVDEDDD